MIEFTIFLLGVLVGSLVTYRALKHHLNKED